MKYYEQIKSIVLIFLVALSIWLTFSIWTYKPNYEVIEDNNVDSLTVGKIKKIQQVLQPMRILLSNNGQLFGTVSSNTIEQTMETISHWQATDVTFVDNNLTNTQINELIEKRSHLTLYYSTEVPMISFQSLLAFSKKDIPDISFNRLIIDWSNLSKTNSIQLYFLSTNNRTLYSTDVLISESNFQSKLLDEVKDTIHYTKIERDNELPLYVPNEPMELVQYTYYIDEISPELFRDILFKDSSIVQKNTDSGDLLKYTDGMSLMTIDTNSKVLNYVYPASETSLEISESNLFDNNFEFINDHGGFTGDYRFVSMNLLNHVTEYQLFMHGYPVYSNVTSTSITTVWGEKEIFRYKRPYFLLDMDISSEKKNYQLPSGIDMIEAIKSSNKLDVNDIEDFYVGYYLTQNESNLLYTLEPCYFAITNDSWVRITPKLLGGDEYGLE